MLVIMNCLEFVDVEYHKRRQIQTNCNFNKEHTYYQGHYLYRIAYRPAVL